MSSQAFALMFTSGTQGDKALPTASELMALKLTDDLTMVTTECDSCGLTESLFRSDTCPPPLTTPMKIREEACDLQPMLKLSASAYEKELEAELARRLSRKKIADN